MRQPNTSATATQAMAMMTINTVWFLSVVGLGW
jgi:hypothetical protein